MDLATPDDGIQLENGISGKPITIASATPENYYEVISNTRYMATTPLAAQLFLPEGAGPFPTVIIVPGSLGLQTPHFEKANLLTSAGIAVCAIDPFKTRGIVSTVANQAQYSFAASAWDVLATAVALAERSEFDTGRIGVQGHSRGGSAALTAASSCFNKVSDAPKFSGVYAAYPWCGHQFITSDIGRTKVRAIIGDQDDWCLPQQVQGHIQSLRASGGKASIKIVEGAHHSFDRKSPVELVEDASVMPGAPTIYLANDGAMIHPLNGHPDPKMLDRESMLYGIKAGYGKKGARIAGGDSGAADIFERDMMDFWRATLL